MASAAPCRSERPPAAALSATLEALAGTRLLVVGDVMVDRTVQGRVERLSPEAPVPVLRCEREWTGLGGAGNLARNLAAFGARASLVTLLGDDWAGAEIRRLLAAEPALESRALVAEAWITCQKQRCLAGNRQLLRLDREHRFPLTPALHRELLAAVEAALPGAAAVVLSDYGKGLLAPAVTRAVMAAARRAKRPVIVDPKGPDWRAYRGAALITPNRAELEAAAALPAGDDHEVVRASRALMLRFGIARVLATRGARGMTLVARRGPARHLAAQAARVEDVTGAGDTVAAVMAAALAAGCEPGAAAALASVAAGIAVGEPGTSAVTPAQVRGALFGPAGAPGADKVRTLATLQAEAAAWRRDGRLVGLANGCFDLLHPGHLSLLRQARAACDRLVVAVNDDASLRALKGPGRPLQTAAARAELLAALDLVDRVVVFAEPTPLAVVEALRPDVLVKGADHAAGEIVGAAQVEARGGRVVIAELLPGYGSSGIAQRLASLKSPHRGR